MAKITDIHNPSFVMFPINNNRTAWRAFGTPMIMVVPHKRTPDNIVIENSGIFNLRIYIEKVPQIARVAGHDHVGLKFPDRELFALNLNSIDLKDHAISLDNLIIKNPDGDIITIAEAKTGDIITYTTIDGVTDTIEYLAGADYYDLSDQKIEMELLPSDYYNLIYETQYYKRIVSLDENSEFLCIDLNTISLAIFSFQIDHPGKVIDQFYDLTPPPYLTNSAKALDTTVAFYRPFTDILQDIMDEQDLLERINWVFDAPPDAIPYLSSLLGWDIPYFPESLDRLRRAVLRRTVEFQNLKGSRRAIINIFKLFGFEVLINNLWWSEDGKRFIRPDERLPAPYQDQEITTIAKNQVDLILSDWATSGFTTLTIPLLYRPQERAGFDRFSAFRDNGNLIIDAYLVDINSEAYTVLKTISDTIIENPIEYGSTIECLNDDNNYTFPTTIYSLLSELEVMGYSQIHINDRTVILETTVGSAPLNDNIRFNRETNQLDFTLNGYMDLSESRIFIFATYKRYNFIVPESIAHLQSNRFDLQILTKSLAEFVDPTTMEFAIEFLYRLKAFHSLLNVIRTRIELTETYEVTDLQIGGDVQQRWDTDIGRLQVPPAIIPQIPDDLTCALLDPRSLGYKESDIIFRLRKLANLPEEHEAWKALDDRQYQTGNFLINPMVPDANRDSCLYNPHGQDRIAIQDDIDQSSVEFSPPPYANQDDQINNNATLSPIIVSHLSEFKGDGISATRNNDARQYGSYNREFTTKPIPICELDGVTDYRYKGRVADEILYRLTANSDESFQFRPCTIGIGSGVYWAFPAFSNISISGVHKPTNHSNSAQMRFSGNAPQFGIQYFSSGIQNKYLTADYNIMQNNYTNSFMGKLYRNYSMPIDETIHYTNRNNDFPIQQYEQLALQKPNLNIDKAILHLPGCRFIRMNALFDDFIHPTWPQRPWDYNNYCGPEAICGDRDQLALNAIMRVDTNGDEYLEFDEQSYTIIGNGLIPDIENLNDHSLGTDADFSESDVIHKVYMKDATSNPAITFDQVSDYDSSIDDGFISTTISMFNSATQCTTDEYLDYADGYASLSGFVSKPDNNIDRSGLYTELLEGLGVPDVSETDFSEVLFLLSSGIRIEKGLRLDCGCLSVSCEGTTTSVLNLACSSSLYIDDEGQYDWNPDHLQLTSRLVFEDITDATVSLLDGTISSLLELF